jgi:hypothetical protein
MIQRDLPRRAAGSRGRLAATGSQSPYYRTKQARDSSAAATAARSEVAAASCAGVHVMPMTSTTITMISGIRRRSSSSRCVHLAGGVLVKDLPSDRWGSATLPCLAGGLLRVPVTQAGSLNNWPEVAGF